MYGDRSYSNYFDFGGSNIIMAKFNGDMIVSNDGNTLYGYKKEYVEEMELRLENYYNKLVEVGIIEKPLDPQVVIKQQAEALKEATDLIKQLKEEKEKTITEKVVETAIDKIIDKPKETKKKVDK